MIIYLGEPVARAHVEKGNKILVDVPHDGITQKEDRFALKNIDGVLTLEDVGHGDVGARDREELGCVKTVSV